MLLSFIYLVFVSLLKLLIRSGRPAQVKDIELIVLRHQLDVLRRQIERPRLRSSGRALLAAASRLLPPRRRHDLLVTPPFSQGPCPGHPTLQREPKQQPPSAIFMPR
jgi:putative transposase